MTDKTSWQALDLLSPPARAATEANAGAAYTQLVVKGEGTAAARAVLAELRPDSLFTVAARSDADARAALSGLWLWHDWLGESHTISQSITTPAGSFWHAIMHRREGDFSNAKYWYARCRHHPVLREIATLERQGGAGGEPLHRVTDEGWDPDAFVDVVEAVHRTPEDPLHAAAVRLQQLEWRALFGHCVRHATGRS